MSLNYTGISGQFLDGQGNPLSGTLTFTPNVTVYASGIPVLQPDVPVQAQITGGELKNLNGGALQLLATDNAGLSYEGQTGFFFWSVSITVGANSLDPWQFFLPYDSLGAGPVDLWSLANTAAGGGSYLPLPSGSPADGDVPVVTAASPLALDWAAGGASAVSSVFGRTGAVIAVSGDYSVAQVTGAAPLASPAFTVSPTAPTQTTGDSTTKIATDQFVSTAVAASAALALQKASNLSDVASAGSARTNLGLGSAATQASSAFDAAGAAASALAAAIAACLPTMTQASVTGSGTLAADVLTTVTAASGVAAMALPAPVTGALIVVEREAASSQAVTVTGNIRGVASTTITLQLASESEMFLGAGSSWWPVAGHKTLSSLQALFLSLAGGTLTGGLAVGGAFSTTPAVLTDAAIILVNAAASNYVRVTLGGSRTLGTPSNPADGQQMIVEVIQPASGGPWTLSYSGAYVFPASWPQPSLSTAANDHDFIWFVYSASESAWVCTGYAIAQFAALVAIAQGGTGQVTQQAAINALTGVQTSGWYLRSGGTNAVLSAIQAADLPAATTSVQGAVIIDGAAGDIQPVGTAAAAGSKGEAADSEHVHLGFFGGIFGSGSDGPLVLNGTNTYAGMSLSGSVYTVSRDIQATSITISGGVTLKTANFRIFARGTITNAGTISSTGNAAIAGAGGLVNVSGSMGGGRAGGAGGTGVSGAGAAGTGASMGSSGGAGGAGTSGAAGAGGTATDSAATVSASLLLSPCPVLTGFASYALSTLIIEFGAGGGGGGSDVTSNAGGGGGGGGGVVALLAFAVVNTGTISANGGNGAAGTAGNAGGGGGGAGGAILAYTLTAWTAGSATAAGGAQGAGSGTGSAGSAGGTGLVLNSVLA